MKLNKPIMLILAAIAMIGIGARAEEALGNTIAPNSLALEITTDTNVLNDEESDGSAVLADSVATPVAAAAEVEEAPQVETAADSTQNALPQLTLNTGYPHHGMDWRMFKSVTNPATRPYTFWEDQTWVGIPLFFAGMIAKSEKAAFRQNYKNPNRNIRLIKYNFHSEIDNYTQYVPLALTIGLHLGGYEGRSDWPRFWASSAMSAAIMAGLVNGIKYTAKEMRPDGSSRNAWPSGHTATAFMAATILHKEYGLTRSRWFSLGAYTLATATGVMRVLNNRHWVSDVLSGAGIGILSVELGYGICDLLFKGKGLLRNDLVEFPDLRKHPSFFDISMGMGFGNKHLDLPAFKFDLPEELVDDSGTTGDGMLHLQFRTATVLGAEAAWFFCPYVGIGGRLRVKTTPINGWSQFALSEEAEYKEFMADPDMLGAVRSIQFTIESDHLTEFAADAGVYFSLPLTERFALGSKAIIGRSVMNDIEVSAAYEGKELAMDLEGYLDGTSTDLMRKTDTDVSGKWTHFNVHASNSVKFGSGISLAYAHKNMFAFKVFMDYDYSRKTFTATYNPFGFLETLSPSTVRTLNELADVDITQPAVSKTKKSLHQWVLGGALSIRF